MRGPQGGCCLPRAQVLEVRRLGAWAREADCCKPGSSQSLVQPQPESAWF